MIMNHRIELLIPSDVADVGGGNQRTYVSTSPPTRLWAEELDTDTTEATITDQLAVTTRRTIQIYHRSNVTHQMRVLYDDGRQYAITSIEDPDDSRRKLRLQIEAQPIP